MVPRLRTFLGSLLRPTYLRRTVRPDIFHPPPKVCPPRPATWPGHIMYQADGRPRRWRYFIAISGLAGILYLAQWYNADPDARRAAGILASHLCRVDAEEYARVDFSSFDACMGYYNRLWSRFDVLARASPEWQDEAHVIMRKAAEEVHAVFAWTWT
ncbi:hypothetical protein B0H14DRAFT_3447982 [Mycena olivaceomarginata]|nr:hypothetical protein B0H14DRAFT_3447982 [Mycena olivaceomarginata]